MIASSLTVTTRHGVSIKLVPSTSGDPREVDVWLAGTEEVVLTSIPGWVYTKTAMGLRRYINWTAHDC